MAVDYLENTGCETLEQMSALVAEAIEKARAARSLSITGYYTGQDQVIHTLEKRLNRPDLQSDAMRTKLQVQVMGWIEEARTNLATVVRISVVPYSKQVGFFYQAPAE
jgi:hypothetical protein